MNLKKLNASLTWRDKDINDLANFLGISTSAVYTKCGNGTWKQSEIEAVARYLNLKPGHILAIFFDRFCAEYNEAHER